MGQFPHDSVTAGHPTTTQTEDHEAVESNRRMATTFLRLILISIPIAGLLLYFSVHGRTTAQRAAPHTAPAVQKSAADPAP